MMIVVGSMSKVKIGAVREAAEENGLHVNVIGVQAASDINEQPLDGETLQGARNRLLHARELFPNADLYVAIENGIFAEADGYYDKAVVVVHTKDGTGYIH